MATRDWKRRVEGDPHGPRGSFAGLAEELVFAAEDLTDLVMVAGDVLSFGVSMVVMMLLVQSTSRADVLSVA